MRRRRHRERGGLFAGVNVRVNPAMFLEVIVVSPLREYCLMVIHLLSHITEITGVQAVHLSEFLC